MTRTVLVTGGARGIGRAIVEAFAPDHNVAYTVHKSAHDAVQLSCPKALPIVCDLAQPQAAQTVIDTLTNHFGGLDVIVNNAGLIAPTPADGYDAALTERIFAVNTHAPAALLSAALPHLSSGAAIVSISSVNAVLPPKGAVAYGASKAALNNWTQAMAKEMAGRGIRVNAVAPGAIDNPDAPRAPEDRDAFAALTALGRQGRPEEIAHAVRFLASREASFITGQVLRVCGGYRL